METKYRFSRSSSSFPHSISFMYTRIHAAAAFVPVGSYKFSIRAMDFIYVHANFRLVHSISFIGTNIFVRCKQIHYIFIQLSILCTNFPIRSFNLKQNSDGRSLRQTISLIGILFPTLYT